MSSYPRSSRHRLSIFLFVPKWIIGLVSLLVILGPSGFIVSSRNRLALVANVVFLQGIFSLTADGILKPFILSLLATVIASTVPSQAFPTPRTILARFILLLVEFGNIKFFFAMATSFIHGVLKGAGPAQVRNVA